MKPDKDKPWTWVQFRKGLCTNCYGACCTMPVEVRSEDLVRLGVTSADEVERSPKKLAKKLVKDGIVSAYREGTDLFTLSSRPNGDCLFLDQKSRLCTVYEKRPDVCRKFPDIGPKPGFCPAFKKSN
jgi:uncharacterized protein